LHYELDDLLPLLAAARLLGWATVHKGRYDLTEEGRRMADADEAGRKPLFRKRAREAPLLRMVLQALEAAAGRPVPREAILASLSGVFSGAEAARQFDRAVDWGRYGELFDYDAEAGCLTPLS
jgi:NitT/TauT family transport system ATP-binding protein